MESVVAAMTVGELARLANTTVEKIVDAATNWRRPNSDGRAVVRKPATAARLPKPRVSRADKVVAVYDVLKLLARSAGPMDIRSISKAIGGETKELRAALKRLAASGQVRISGERRATRYSAR